MFSMSFVGTHIYVIYLKNKLHSSNILQTLCYILNSVYRGNFYLANSLIHFLYILHSPCTPRGDFFPSAQCWSSYCIFFFFSKAGILLICIINDMVKNSVSDNTSCSVFRPRQYYDCSVQINYSTNKQNNLSLFDHEQFFASHTN